MMLEICAYGDSIGVMRVKEVLVIQWLQCERLQCRIEVERGPCFGLANDAMQPRQSSACGDVA